MNRFTLHWPNARRMTICFGLTQDQIDRLVDNNPIKVDWTGTVLEGNSILIACQNYHLNGSKKCFRFWEWAVEHLDKHKFACCVVSSFDHQLPDIDHLMIVLFRDEFLDDSVKTIVDTNKSFGECHLEVVQVDEIIDVHDIPDLKQEVSSHIGKLFRS